LVVLGLTGALRLGAQSMNPTSGSGMSQTFTISGLWESIRWVNLAFGPNGTAAGSCKIQGFAGGVGYFQSVALSMGVDGNGNEIWSGAGQNQSISNSYCTITGWSGNFWPSASVSITFSPAMLGAQTIYRSLAWDDGNGDYGQWDWSQVGTWTVSTPTVSTVSVSPASGSGATQTFAFTYSSSVGAGDVTTGWAYFTPSYNNNPANTCEFYYDRASNRLSLNNDAGTAWTSATLGVAGSLQNSQCTLNTGGATASSNGNNLTVSVPVTFKNAFSGAKQVWMYAADQYGNTGWQQRGTWAVPSSAAVAPVSVTPPAGLGMSQTFTLVYEDTNGATDIGNAVVYWANGPTICYLNYSRPMNLLFLLNDAQTGFLTGTPGAAGTIQNSQCSIDTGGASASTAGNNLTLVLPVTFKNAYSGQKTVYMYVDNPLGNSGWQNKGSWNVTPVSVMAVTPTGGASMSQTFTVAVADSNGVTDLTRASLFFTANLANGPAGTCQIYYDRTSNNLYLLNDAGTAWTSTLAGGSGTLSNSQCSLAAAGSTAVGSGTALTATFALTFANGFTGPKLVYAAGDNGTSGTGWLPRGNWNVQAAPGTGGQDFTVSAAPSVKPVVRGGSATYTVTIAGMSGTAAVNLSASGLPAGATATFAPQTLNGAGASTLTVTTTAGTPAGTANITLTATSGAFSHNTTVALQVEASGYGFYLTDAITAINGTNWTQAGSVAASAGGLTATDANGGSLISRVGIPDGTSDYEVRANVTLVANGGNYTLFARATPDARTGAGGAGSFYAFEMQNPVFANGWCSASYVVYKRVSGVTTLLGQWPGACANGMQLRLMVQPGTLTAWANTALGVTLTDYDIGAGQPGVGAAGTPSGNSITNVQTGALDRVAPNAINSQTIGVAAFANRIELQWPGVNDDPAGIGLAYYQINRDGLPLGTSPRPDFADLAVNPGESHTYTIAAVDQHGNTGTAAAATIAVPPAGSIEPPAHGCAFHGRVLGRRGRADRPAFREPELLGAAVQGTVAHGVERHLRAQLQFASLAQGRGRHVESGARHRVRLRLAAAGRVDHAGVFGHVGAGPLHLHGFDRGGVPAGRQYQRRVDVARGLLRQF
jgi:hypothetical protein